MRVAGRYELVERLGGGGMGEVFRARDLHLRRDVAIKRLLPHLVHREDLVQRSEREGQILASLRHPAIIDVYDMLDSPDGGKFLILELVPGRSLAAELRSERRLRWSRCADIGIQVCGALTAAHAASVIHRDIKPANILVSDDGVVHVADFGIARLTGSPTATAEGSMIGTPDYWAPEQATRGEITASSDIYSLCCVLFEAACGRPPFVADPDASPAAVFVMHVVRPVPDPHDVAPDLPEEARDILMTGLAKDPAERFTSAEALASALAASRTAEPSEVETRGPAISPVSVAPAAAPEDAAPAVAVETAAPANAGPGHGRADETISPDDPAPETTPPATPPTEERTARNALTVASASARNAETLFSTGPIEAPPKGSRRPRPALLAAGGVALAILLGAGLGTVYAATRDDSPAPVVVGTKEVTAGHIRATVPADWTSQPARPGRYTPFTLGSALDLRPPTAAAAKEAIILGTSTATGPLLLPDGLSPKGRSVVKMGELVGYRYTGLRAGGRAVTAYVAPASDGVTTVLCPAKGDAGSASVCIGVVSSLELVGASPLPLGPDPSSAAALGRAIGRANSSLARASGIANAPSAAAQAAAASSVATGLRQSIKALPASGEYGPALKPAVPELRASLASLASGYEDLASAAKGVNTAGWDAARAAIESDANRLDRAMSLLGAAGYRAK